jgi:hypothetical protein
MLFKLIGPIVLSFASSTLEQLEAQMSTLVVFLITFSDEPLIAERALEGFVAGVGPSV